MSNSFRFRALGEVSTGASTNQASTKSLDWRVDPRAISTLLGRNEIFPGTRDAKLLHPEVKGGPLHSQACGRPVGTCDNPPGSLESLANMVSLRVLQRNCANGFRFHGALQTRERGVQDIARSEDNATLDEILKLANVARPLIGGEGGHRFRGDLLDFLTHPAGINSNKMLDQVRNVFTPCSQ